jgi:cephalosporin-C deacetylase-like acetyl esterase
MPSFLRPLPLCLLFLSCVASSAELSIRGTTDKDVAIYKPGEKIEFTLRVLDGEAPVAGKLLKWTRSGDDGKTETGEGTATAEGLKVATTLDKPGFVRLLVKAFDTDGKPLQGYVGGWGANKNGEIFFDGGACVEPEQLQPVAEPKDFDEFWTMTKAKLEAVPVKADLKELPSKNPKVKLYAATIDCAGPKAVTGYLTVPVGAKDKSLPGIVQFQGYGVNQHNPPGWLNEGAIFLEINAHGMELGKDEEYYKQLKKDLANYCFKDDENADREKTYYYGMALRVMRALQYVKSRPEWNGMELQSNGGSQGGLQGLWGAGLDSDVTSSEIWSPWSCDFGGITLGRQRGWRPNYNEALNYFDPVFFAKRIKAKVHIVANYGDYTCAPSGVWVVYNNIPGDRKSMLVKQGCTHGYEMKGNMQYTIAPSGITGVGAKK